MSDIKKIRGTSENLFQIGLTGSQVKNSSGVIEIKNAADNAYATLRAASPTADNDVATKKYVDALEGTMIVSRQADCSVARPDNTTTRGAVVVTKAGDGAVVGDVLWDNGLDDSQKMEILAAVEGRTIFVTDALSGGTATFDADSAYVWDADGSTWVKIGDIGSTTGAVREIRYAITNADTQDSTSLIPANARVLYCGVEVTTPYSGGATISVGQAGSLALIQATTDNYPQGASTYSVDQDTAWGGSALVVRTTIAGAPAAGAGVVVVRYTVPNA